MNSSLCVFRKRWDHSAVCNNNNIIAAMLARFRHSFASCGSILLHNFTSLHVKSNMYTYTEFCVWFGADLKSPDVLCCDFILKIVVIVRPWQWILMSLLRRLYQQYIYDIFLLLHTVLIIFLLLIIFILKCIVLTSNLWTVACIYKLLGTCSSQWKQTQ